VGLRQEVRLPRPRTTCRSGPFDLTSDPRGPAVFQRQDGIGRRWLGKGRRVRRVIPAWRGQRTATNQNGRRPSRTAWCALSLTATVAVHRKTNICIYGFSGAGNRPFAAPAPLPVRPAASRPSSQVSISLQQPSVLLRSETLAWASIAGCVRHALGMQTRWRDPRRFHAAYETARAIARRPRRCASNEEDASDAIAARRLPVAALTTPNASGCSAAEVRPIRGLYPHAK